VGGYVGATVAYETFFLEDPDARGWVQINEWGRPMYYNSEQTFRYLACRNNPGYMDFLRKVMRMGVEDLGLDLIHFDQMQMWGEPRSCRCEYCTRAFRAFVRDSYSDDRLAQRFGFTRLDGIVPPPFNSIAGPIGMPELVNPLMQEWARFRAASVTRHYAEFDRYLHSLNPEVALEGNPNLNFGQNKGWREGIDYGALLQHGDIVWSEEPNYAEWTADGRLVSKIRSFKAVRSMGKSLFLYTGPGYTTPKSPSHLLLAEAMAYNDMNLGNVGAVNAEGTTLTPEARNYIDFFHAHKRDLVDTTEVADAAVLHSFASVELNPAVSLVSKTLAEQVLIQSRIPFAMIFDRHLAQLSRYKVLVLADQDALSDEQCARIRAFVSAGGGLVATGTTSLLTEWRLRRPKFALSELFGISEPPAGDAPNKPLRNNYGKGRVVYIPRIEPSIEPPEASMSYTFGSDYWSLPRNSKDLAGAVAWAAGGELSARVEAPEYVTLELAEQKASRTWLLHLVNYNPARVQKRLAVRLKPPAGFTVRQAMLASPDGGILETLKLATGGDGAVSFSIPKLQVYDLVLLSLEKR
ncbi:MAG: beta-galactosidase, partial [Acidobacteria bacterium]|nr:beta-galactosidase [Acidobacteriota bacterium]